MERLALVLSLSLASCASPSHQNETQSKVYVLGSIHGNMLGQPNNSLRDFLSAIDQYKPTLILNEVRPEFANAVEGTIDGGPEQSLVYAYAKEKGATVVPVDWFDDQYNDDSSQEDSRQTEALKSEIQPLLVEFLAVIQKGTFLDSQSPRTQSVVRKRYDILEQHGFKSLRLRDEKICQNLQKQSPKFAGQRVLIVFGLAHKYFLDDCLKNVGVRTVAAKSWFDPKKVVEFKVSDSLKSNALRTFYEAKELLSKRLSSGYYKSDVANLKEKLEELDAWIRETIALSPPTALTGELGILKRPDGRVSTELSITVNDPRLNNSRATNIPLLVKGQVDVDKLLREQNPSPSKQQVEIAIKRAAERVAAEDLPSYDSIEAAEIAAKARSEAGGSIEYFKKRDGK